MTATIHSHISHINQFIGKPATSFSKIETALDEIGRANRRKDKVAAPFVRDNAERVFIKVAALGTPRANRAARNMIRRDFLPSSCDIDGLKALTKGNAELTTYVAELEARIAKPIGELDAEEVLRLDSNRFTQRLLRKQGKLAALEQRHAESAIQKIEKEKPSAAVQSRYATWRHAASPGGQGTRRDSGATDKTGASDLAEGTASKVVRRRLGNAPASSLHGDETTSTANRPTEEAQHTVGKEPVWHDSAVSDLRPTHYPSGKEPASVSHSALGMTGKAEAVSTASLPRMATVALDLLGCPASPEQSFTPAIDCQLPPTIDADYKNLGQCFHLLKRLKTEPVSEEQRFDNAVKAFISLVDMQPASHEARLFKHMPDLIHRLFTTPSDTKDAVEEALEQIREGLRDDGKQLTPTAQKLLVWMAIAWDGSCLKLDDPTKVDMRERDGQFEVLERNANGQETWRAARDGKLDLTYTTSLIASWFKHPKAIQFDKAALQNIGVTGPLYRSRDGRVEFAPGGYLRMGKNRLRSLGACDYLHPAALDAMHRVLHQRRQLEPISLHIDLETLPPAPLDLGNLTEFVWGETHGNTAVELYALHAVGMIRIKSPEGWQAIRTAIDTANYGSLDALLAMHIEHGPKASGRTFVLLGNTLAGPMGNDLIELQVRYFLRDRLKINMPELQSRNNVYFDAYWKMNQDKDFDDDFDMPANLTPHRPTGQGDGMASLQQMNRLMNSNDRKIRQDVRLLLKTCAASYYKDDRLQLCRVAEDGRTLLSGGRSNQALSRALEEQLNAGRRLRPNLAMKEKVGMINTLFRNKVLSRDADAYLAATHDETRAETGGTGAVGNPIAAYIGGYDASLLFPDMTLDRGIDRNVSAQATRIDAYWLLHNDIQTPLMDWIFKPFEAYVEATRLTVDMSDSSPGTRLFWRDEFPDNDIRLFDKLVASCLYELPRDAEADGNEANAHQQCAANVLGLSYEQLMTKLKNADGPERALLAPLKTRVVNVLQDMREPLRAWDRMHSVKSLMDQQVVDEALAQLKILPTTADEIDALSRQDLVELLFSGAIARLFNYCSMWAKHVQSHRDYAQTRFALNSHAGSEPQHRKFYRTFFGF